MSSSFNTQQQMQQHMQQGLMALQQGRAEQAKQMFTQAVSAMPNNTQAWLGLAFAESQLQQGQSAIAAVDKVLLLEPKNIRALIFKADQLVNMGQERQALTFFDGALQIAAGQSNLPSDIQNGLQRALQIQEKYNKEYESYLLQALKDKGYERGVSARFDESLDISFGKSPIYLQEPTRFYFPGLPQRTFYEREEFNWVEALEAATDDIRTELQQLMSQDSGFKPYLEAEGNEPNFVGNLNIIDSLNWGACYIYEYGKLIEQNASLCPKTTEALDKVPLPYIPSQTPIALFSKLKPGIKIPPHHGLLNTRLICHLPIIVPKDCGGIRVGHQTRTWEEGKTLIFDDSIEHEAWNNSNEERVVLLFDIWRPELTEDERRLITDMLIVVEQFGD